MTEPWGQRSSVLQKERKHVRCTGPSDARSRRLRDKLPAGRLPETDDPKNRSGIDLRRCAFNIPRSARCRRCECHQARTPSQRELGNCRGRFLTCANLRDMGPTMPDGVSMLPVQVVPREAPECGRRARAGAEPPAFDSTSLGAPRTTDWPEQTSVLFVFFLSSPPNLSPRPSFRERSAILGKCDVD